MINANHNPKDTTVVDIEVGRLIKERRKNLKMSQTEVAKELGITFQQVQKYESGSNRISLVNFFKFCNILKIDAMLFFENIGSNLLSGVAKLSDSSTEDSANFFSTLKKNDTKFIQELTEKCKNITSKKKQDLLLSLADSLID